MQKVSGFLNAAALCRFLWTSSSVFLLIAWIGFDHVLSQTFPTVRDARKWPFTATSIWNMPIGSSAGYVFGKIQPASVFEPDENIIFMTPDSPKVSVYRNTAGWSGASRCGTVTSTVVDQNWPIPRAFNTEGLYIGTMPNASAACLLSDGLTIHQGQPFHRCGVGGTATMGGVKTDGTYNIETGNGMYGAHGGSGLSALGGTIRVGEILPGAVIRHAMAIQLWSAEDYYAGSGLWPATNSDGAKGGTVSQVREGALMALLPTFPVDSLLTVPAKIIARAFIDYGAYINDDTYWDCYSLCTEWGPGGRVIDEFKAAYGYSMIVDNWAAGTNLGTSNWGKDLYKMFTSLYAVANNTASTIGGGGTPRQPLAPPFGVVAIRSPRTPAVIPVINSLTTGSCQVFDIRGRKINAKSAELTRKNMGAGVYIARASNLDGSKIVKPLFAEH